MKSKYIDRWLAAVIAASLSACVHDPSLPDSPLVSFNDQVRPVIVSNCATAGCHDGDREFRLATYDEMARRVTAGQPQKSKIYSVITKLTGEEAMPPAGPLSDDQIRLIYVWIQQGAKNN